jgi:tRNA G10  N-methylase Trm11
MAKDFEKMSKPELKAYADKKGIDISSVKLKEDIINVLKEDEIAKGIEKAEKKAKSQKVLGVEVEKPGDIESIKEAVEESVSQKENVVVKPEDNPTTGIVRRNDDTDMTAVNDFQQRLKEKRALK